MHMKNAKNGDPTIFTNGKHGAPKICRTFWGPDIAQRHSSANDFCTETCLDFLQKKWLEKRRVIKKMFFGKMTLINGSSCMSCMSLESFPTTYCNLIKCVDQACTCSVMFGLKTPSRGLSMGLETNQNSVCGYVLGVGQKQSRRSQNDALPKKLKQRSLKTFRITQCSIMHEEMTSKHG